MTDLEHLGRRAGPPARGLLATALALTLVVLGPDRAAGQQVPPELRRVHELLSGFGRVGFSGAAAVDLGDGRVMTQGYGVRDRETGDPVTAETVFTLGSVTKQFTAAAILALVEDGRLALTDSLPRFFPGTPPDKAGITVHHLLTHSSGLPDVLGDDWDLRATREWIVERALAAELRSTPGEIYDYSNLGYSMLGRIVEVVSGEDYETFLRRRFFTPLGMLHTGYVLPRFAAGQVAVGYEGGRRWGTVLEHPMLEDGPSWNLRANGGMHTTPGDMLRWHRALADGSAISRGSVELASTPYIDEGGGESYYGYGWSLYDLDGGIPVVGHDGGNGVFSADFRRYPTEGAAILLFSSSPDFPAPALAELTQAMLFEGAEPFIPPPVTLSPERLRTLSGRYVLGEGDTVRVAPEGSGVQLETRSCRAQYYLSGGTAPLPEDVAGVAGRTVAILEAAVRGDFAPLRQLFPPDYDGSAFDVQRRYNRMQEEAELGNLLDVRLQGCGAYEEDQIRIVVRFDYEEGPWFRSLRWRESGLAGYGIHGAPPGERRDRVFVPLDSTRFRGISLSGDAPADLRFDPSTGRMTIETEAGAVVVEAVRVGTVLPSSRRRRSVAGPSVERARERPPARGSTFRLARLR